MTAEVDSPASFCLHRHLPLSVSAAHHGPGPADRGAQDRGAAHRQTRHWDRAARFWGRIFAINFVFGVVTGIPMEFEFGTNWARFSRLSGGVIGQPLAMEGVFSFFLESAFLGLFLYGEKRLSKLMHWFSAVMVLLGSWISGFFIIVTDAWMQHPGRLRPPARRPL